MAVDPRHYQIAMLSVLLTYGITWLAFDVTPARVLLILATTISTQWLCGRLWGLPRFDVRSPLISGLSLSLLLRTTSPGVAAGAAVVAIAGKFVLRHRGKHLFNPTNLALVAAIACSDAAWVSPGQWGSATYLAFLMACLGGLVVNRAVRSDVTVAFIAAWIVLVAGRSIWVGEPMTIPLHRLQNGALLLFTFFMISDPRTTPDSRAGRVVFACLVALGAWYIQFFLFRTNGLLWSLAGCALLTPAIDRLLPGARYTWARPTTGRGRIEGASTDDTPHHLGTRPGGAGLVQPVAPGVLRVLRREG